MLRRSSSLLESLFDGSGGIAGHPNNVPGPRSRNRRHPAPEPCSATVRRVCSRGAGLTVPRPAGLRAGKRALHSRKRKHVTMIKHVGTCGVSAAKKKKERCWMTYLSTRAIGAMTWPVASRFQSVRPNTREKVLAELALWTCKELRKEVDWGDHRPLA